MKRSLWLILLLSSQSVWANFDDALLAYHQGHYTRAISEFKRLAKVGDVTAQYNLAYMYARGLGVNKDYDQALTWFYAAAQRGDAESQFHLAGLYEQGLGIKQSHEKALNWYRQSALKGYLPAQITVAGLYGIGLGVEHDAAQSWTWLSVADSQRTQPMIAEAKALLQEQLSPQQLQKAQHQAQAIIKQAWQTTN
ncbi:tetratricopeptide repeat protein [uncultured Agitococcus sp.]|uniref:tetratricopeptide repeat protein n=1 Tax=uncultured Agitococcus sp. TaxID=1506599 RepID=UPI00260D1214|nr:tetratricopeptide repeat protein [uncultured Agitococcus sp.]